jgi:hypothetical protein
MKKIILGETLFKMKFNKKSEELVSVYSLLFFFVILIGIALILKSGSFKEDIKKIIPEEPLNEFINLEKDNLIDKIYFETFKKSIKDSYKVKIDLLLIYNLYNSCGKKSNGVFYLLHSTKKTCLKFKKIKRDIVSIYDRELEEYKKPFLEVSIFNKLISNLNSFKNSKYKYSYSLTFEKTKTEKKYYILKKSKSIEFEKKYYIGYDYSKNYEFIEDLIFYIVKRRNANKDYKKPLKISNLNKINTNYEFEIVKTENEKNLISIKNKELNEVFFHFYASK